MEDSNDRKRSRDELEIYSPEVKRLRENLLDNLDDDTEFGSVTDDLDSFMQSFADEITASPSAGAEALRPVDLTSDSGDSRPDLGYLFEASDDELGLPPTASTSGEAVTELVRVDSESSQLGNEFWEAPGYDSFEFGLEVSLNSYSGGNGEYMALDGLFDYSDMGFGCRPETLPAQ